MTIGDDHLPNERLVVDDNKGPPIKEDGREEDTADNRRRGTFFVALQEDPLVDFRCIPFILKDRPDVAASNQAKKKVLDVFMMHGLPSTASIGLSH
jgi:hypothetical protein